MSIRLRHQALCATAAVLMVAGCSARGPADTTDAGRASTAPRAHAAQRIVLPGAEQDVAAGSVNAATIRRALPATPEVIRLPDGTVGVKVAAQYFDTVVACRQADGSFGTNCPPARQERP